MSGPNILRGAAAIGAHLGMTAEVVEQLHDSRAMPTFVMHDEICATAAALDDWTSIVCLVFTA